LKDSLKSLLDLNKIRATRAKKNFSYFVDYDSDYQDRDGRHLDVLDETLMKVSKGEIKRLIVTMPPRHGKSERVSKKFPAWHQGNNPNDEIIISSYSLDLSRGFSRIARDTLKGHQNIFDVEISKDRQAAESWGLEGTRGGVSAAGVGGPITGKGAKIAIIDDPVKNSEEANSQVIRDKVWEWYQTTLYTRLTPDGRIIIVMTRWHEDDLVGRLLKKEQEEIKNGSHEGERWTVINFPAIAEENDFLGRKEGEPLWPEFGFDRKRLDEIKRDVGSYTFNALYQQRPSAQEGGMLKRNWWKYYRQLPPLDELIQSWDCTFKDSDGSDFVAGHVWGRKGAQYFLVDRVKARMDLPTTVQSVRNMTAKHPKGLIKLIEDKANGPAVIQLLKNRIPGMIAVNPEGGKIARASAVSPAIEAGNVFLPSPDIAHWVHDFVEECAAFPKGAHDDDVDAMTQALNRLIYHMTPEEDKTPKVTDYDHYSHWEDETGMEYHEDGEGYL
jgi:predicted phage terminase large subunit-like protein